MTETLESKNGGVYYAEGQAVQGAPVGRQGHACCGFCCDTRRATIIVNIIDICLSVVALAGLGVISSDGFAAQLDDDTVKNELDMATQYMWIPMLLAGLNIAASGLGIWGAKNYIGWMVMISGLWYAVGTVLSLLGGDIGGAIMSGFFAYPHFVFYQEMKKGIMTEENYPNEIHSCCCV